MGTTAPAFEAAAEKQLLKAATAVTASPLATAAAVEILREGGNAVDAAMAAAWALCVCEPSGSGLGGQTVMLIHMADGWTRVIDGHSHAPATVSTATVSPKQQRQGHRACTIPSTPATLDYAQRRYGMLSPGRVIEPAIRLAEHGYEITPLQSRQTRWVAHQLRDCPAASRLFLDGGEPPRAGFIFRQPELAATLRELRNGVNDFYRGAMARAIASDMSRRGGLMMAADLSRLSVPIERDPISTGYRRHTVMSVPPPGGGRQLLLGLKLIEHFTPMGYDGSETGWRELMGRIIYGVFWGRERQRGAEDQDTAASDALPDGEGCLSSMAGQGLTEARVGCGIEEPGETTHLTVSDRTGNVVALTQSIQSLFGAKVANPDLGFLYNNYLYTCPRDSHSHGLRPWCIPRSNAAPTLVFQRTSRGQQPVLALGAAGSRRIMSSVLQVLSGVIDRGLDISEAVSAPRIHALLSGNVWIEEDGLSAGLFECLGKRYRRVVIKRRHDYTMGAVQALQFLTDGSTKGAADPRREGTVGSSE